MLQGVAQGIDLDQHFSQRVAGPGSAASDREVLLSQCGEEIGQGLQGTNDALASREGETHPCRQQDSGEGPLGQGSPWHVPHQDERHDRGREARQQDEQQDVPIVGEAPLHV